MKRIVNYLLFPVLAMLAWSSAGAQDIRQQAEKDALKSVELACTVAEKTVVYLKAQDETAKQAAKKEMDEAQATFDVHIEAMKQKYKSVYPKPDLTQLINEERKKCRAVEELNQLYEEKERELEQKLRELED